MLIQNIQIFLIPQTSFLVGTFFAASYSKTALMGNFVLVEFTRAVPLVQLVPGPKNCTKQGPPVCFIHISEVWYLVN